MIWKHHSEEGTQELRPGWEGARQVKTRGKTVSGKVTASTKALRQKGKERRTGSTAQTGNGDKVDDRLDRCSW